MSMSEEYHEISGNFYFKHQITKKPSCGALAKHSHNMCELLYFVGGDASCVIEDKRYRLSPGDLLCIRPSKYHFIQIESEADYERYDALFDEDELEEGERARLLALPDVLHISRNADATDIFRRLDVYRAKLDREAFAQMSRLLLRELIYALSVEHGQTPTDFAVINPMLSSALEYINEHLFELHSVGEIASALFITESYLFKLFRTELKQSPKRYVNDKKLLAAQQMILAGESPTKACEACGFGDYVSFYRGYRRLFGRSPSDKVPRATK